MMRTASQDVVHTGEIVRPPFGDDYLYLALCRDTDEEPLVTVEFPLTVSKLNSCSTHERLPDESARTSHSHGWQSILEKLATALR